MAERNPVPSESVDPLELKINSHFDQIIFKVNARRVKLLTELRERREESRARDTQRKDMISQITATKSQIESGLKENPLKQMQEKMINEMEKEMEKLIITSQKKVLQFSINLNIIEQTIEKLGEITEEKETIDYKTFQPIVAVAQKGKAPGELNGPEGVAIDETTGNIFVVEFSNSRVSIFSQTGKYIESFGNQLFETVWGIAIQNNNLYVSDMNGHAVFQFRLPDMKLIRRVGKYGTGKEEFHNPNQLSISEIGDVYVCDQENDRIQILNSELKFKSFFIHESMTLPIDVKLTDALMYVLSSSDNPCLHTFTRSGEKIHSILSLGKGMQITRALFFCIDFIGNIIISDLDEHSIKVFTPEGELLHQIGQQGHEKGMFFKPRGITLSKDGKIICVSDNANFGLQTFS